MENQNITLKEALQEPFAIEDISWKVQKSGKSNNGKIWAIVVPYIKATAIEDRLDDVVGAENWASEKFEPGANGGLQCGISIRIDDEWITKWDGADNTNYEGVKGGMSDAFKRAARRWGIGRYLTKVKSGFANCYEGKDGTHTDYIKEGNKKIYFSWTPPGLPFFCFPKPKETENRRIPDEEWKENAKKFQKDAEELQNIPLNDEPPKDQEATEAKELKERIAGMIKEMKRKKIRTTNNRAAYLEISKEFLKADGDLQTLREIEAKASGLLARQAA